MRVIVVGAGEVGRHISATLSAEGHDVTVIDRDADRVPALQAQLDALVVAGNGASPRVLKDVGARHADLLLAVTQLDEVNLLAAASGHRLGVRRTLARVRESDYFGGDDHFAREVLGVDAVIDPEQATAADIAETLLVPGAVHVEYFADGRIALAEIIVREGSPLAAAIVREREQRRPHSIVGLLRDGRLIVPAGHERALPGDRAFVAAATSDIAAVVRELAGYARPVRDAVIFGGGKIGFALANRLQEQRCAVKVIEQNPERARWLAEHLEHALVLREEDLSEEVLLMHAVDRAAAFVACAGDDRTNLLAALHAKRIGAQLCFAVVSREQFVPLVDAIGIDAAFSLRLTTAEAILRFVRVDTVRALHFTLSGAEVLDLHVDPRAEVDGKPVGTLKDVEVGAILRAGEVIVPGADERFRAGDRVLVFRRRGAAPGVEHLFDA